jgi:hypothetical protein
MRGVVGKRRAARKPHSRAAGAWSYRSVCPDGRWARYFLAEVVTSHSGAFARSGLK